jgi:hypothetical protein
MADESFIVRKDESAGQAVKLFLKGRRGNPAAFSTGRMRD